MNDALPPRSGSRPRTTPTNPHTQLEQQPDDTGVVAELARRAFSLPGVVERPSAISVPGARALWLQDDWPAGPSEAFMIGREFAHLHPTPDHSLHMALPADLVDKVIEAGWAEPHPVARSGLIPPTIVMVYAPRDEVELEVVVGLVQESYQFARGQTLAADVE